MAQIENKYFGEKIYSFTAFKYNTIIFLSTIDNIHDIHYIKCMICDPRFESWDTTTNTKSYSTGNKRVKGKQQRLE